MKKRILEYSITSGACLLLAFIIATLFGIFQYKEDFRIYGAWCDGFFISGFFCLAVGLLLFVHNCGFFDIIVFGIVSFFKMLFRKKNKYDSYYDYSVARAERPKAEFLYFIVVGVVFILIALIFLYFWAKATGNI